MTSKGAFPHRSGPSRHKAALSADNSFGSIVTRNNRFSDETSKTLSAGTYIVFDIETTGGNPQRNGITEICALRVENGVEQDSFYSLVNPGISIPPIVRRMTGITNATVKDAPPIEDVMPGFLEFVGTSILVSHNTIGDLKFLRYFSETCCGHSFENFFICTHLLIDKLAPEAPDKSLSGLGRYFNLVSDHAHRAEADALLTLGLFRVLLEKMTPLKVKTIADAIRLQGDYESGMRLGWGVSPNSLKTLPKQAGVFQLQDRNYRPVLVCSASNLQREVKKLTKYDQLPKPILRAVLQSYHLSYEQQPDTLSSMLRECELTYKLKPAFCASLLHHRVITSLNFTPESSGSVHVSIDALLPGTTLAFGPVRDRKIVAQYLSEAAAIFGHIATKRGVTFSTLESELLAANCAGNFDSWLVENKYAPSDLLKKADQLRRLKFSESLKPLLNTTGLIVSESEAAYQVLYVVDARIAKHLSLPRQGPLPSLEHKLVQFTMQRLVFWERLWRSSGKALTEREACLANALMWWIHGSSSKQADRFSPFSG